MIYSCITIFNNKKISKQENEGNSQLNIMKWNSQNNPGKNKPSNYQLKNKSSYLTLRLN